MVFLGDYFDETAGFNGVLATGSVTTAMWGLWGLVGAIMRTNAEV